jgi:membrane protein
VAFWWFLSIFPAIIAAVGLTQILGAGSFLVRAAEKATRLPLPNDALRLIMESIREVESAPRAASVVATAVGLIISLWSASAGMVAVQKGLDIAYEVPNERRYLRERLVAVSLALITAVLGSIALALLVFGNQIIAVLPPIPEFLWEAVRWTIIVVAIATLFATFYFLGPNRPSPSWQWVSPGGILACVIWIAASFGFAIYAANLASYSRIYGPLAGVVVLLIWLFLTAFALLAGAELNAELERQNELRRSGDASLARSLAGNSAGQKGGLHVPRARKSR